MSACRNSLRARYTGLLYQALYDSKTGRLYLLSFTDPPCTSSVRCVRILVVQLPSFQFAGAEHIRELVEIIGPTELFLSEHGEQLLFIYQKQGEQERRIWVCELYDANSLKLVKTWSRDVHEEWYKLGRFSGHGYFGLDVTAMHEGTLRTTQGCLREQSAPPYFPLSPEARQLLKAKP